MSKNHNEHEDLGLKTYRTSDYSIFRGGANRKIVESNVKDLAGKIDAEGFGPHYAITVGVLRNPAPGEKYILVDGHHRLEAARRSRAEIYYTVYPYINEYNQAEYTKAMNESGKPWNYKDFLNSYADTFGKQDYQLFREDIKGYKLPLTNLVVIGHSAKGQLASRTMQLFKKGEWTYNNRAGLLDLLAKVEDFHNDTFQENTRNFLGAVQRLLAHEDYDHEKMKQQLAVQYGALTRQANIESYYKLLLDIYNYNRRQHNRLSYRPGKTA